VQFPIDLEFDQRKHIHLKRSPRHGYWRNWFTPEDQEFFVSGREPLLESLGYDPKLYRGPQHIDPSEAAGYVERLNGRRLRPAP
jgi:hypothetical protein